MTVMGSIFYMRTLSTGTLKVSMNMCNRGMEGLTELALSKSMGSGRQKMGRMWV